MDDFLGRSAHGFSRESETHLPEARARWTSPGLLSSSPASHEEPSFNMKRPRENAASAPSDFGEQQLGLGIFSSPKATKEYDVAEDSNGAWGTNRRSSGSLDHDFEPDPTPEPTGMITNSNPPGRSIHLSQSASKSRSLGDRNLGISQTITEASSSRLPRTTSVTTIEPITSISEQDEKKGLLVNKLKVGEPVMTEEQFIRACRKYSNDLARENDNNATRKTVHEEATRRLMESYEAWYQHWKKIANLDFDIFPENMTTKMRCMIINYLLYVEMISTTIPISKDAVGSELKKAFELAQMMFGPGRINQQIKNTKMYEECYNIRRQERST
ncbi:hypothetical protein KEM48_009239 [Puccinia striiformis f. sp. tritici PST-130]|nr:hypothetical protein KEM48_009239 [Puccinia striiformis f. sp. tritici PST-130]